MQTYTRSSGGDSQACAHGDQAALARVRAHLSAAAASLRQVNDPGLRSELGSLHAQLVDDLDLLERLRRRARMSGSRLRMTVFAASIGDPWPR